MSAEAKSGYCIIDGRSDIYSLGIVFIKLLLNCSESRKFINYMVKKCHCFSSTLKPE